jgi:outer membrane lipoprotein SlyB
MRKVTLAILAATIAMPVIPAAPASAQSGYYHGKTWRDSRGRIRCRRSNGTVGIIVGGAGGALVGRAVDGGRNHTVGTVVGAAAGALAGRAIDRSRTRRCR